MIDIIIAGFIILTAVFALAIIFFKWRKEKKMINEKVREIVEEAKKNVAPSVLVD